ncbi:aminotransferase class V-fold PLP-dependent enzyme, partial [Streptomyces sp. NRRL B-24085]
MHTPLRPLLDTVLDALGEGTRLRGGPLPTGGPPKVAERMRAAVGDVLPDEGDPEALRCLVRALAEGAADPRDPLCAAHLHCPPLAVAVAADLAVSALNPSLDSWDQAPAASELESLVSRHLAREVYGETPRGAGNCATSPHRPDTLLTTGGTESNQLALLLARETLGPGVRLICGENAHHSLPRAAWLLGMPEPITVPTPTGTLDPAALDEALHGPSVIAATAGTTDAGLIDPLPEIAAL